MGTPSQRILAVDILRGITIAGMILVNNPGSWSHMYAPLRHAAWNGLTPTDLVFPFFMFIMGMSTYLSLSKSGFTFTKEIAFKIVKRSILIFAVGVFIGWFSRFCYYWGSADETLSFADNLWKAAWSFDRMRILGVMQRLAICYATVSLLVLLVRHKYIPHIIAFILLAYSVLLLCGNGFAYNETNILSVVDRAILTPTHMYQDNGIDPEGILSTFPSIAQVLIGFWVGRLVFRPQQTLSPSDMLVKLFLVGAVLTFAGFLLSYGCPINKKVWSPTFVLVTCGLASTLLALLIWTIDIKGYRQWALPFEAFGTNPLFMFVLGGLLSILMGSIRIPLGESSISIRGYLYQEVCMPIFGETGGSLAFAILFILLNWAIGYQLYKRNIYIKI